MEKQRTLQSITRCLGIGIPIIAIAFVVDIPLYLFNVSLFTQQYLALFWSLVTASIFLTKPALKRSRARGPRWYDVLLAVLTLIAGLYVTLFYSEILLTLGMIPSSLEILLGLVTVIVVLESVRRISGWPVVIIVVLFILYAKFGNIMPGIFRTTSLNYSRLFIQLYVGEDFMFGIPLRVCATMVFGFILFGHFVMKSGGGDFLFNFSQALLGRYRGGPAKVAVLASSFFGALSGSAVANVAGTGMVTIPMMKKVGFSPTYAGAIEATASTGGQILPPVMGAAAFVMAEFLGISYVEVSIVALVPALLFYMGLYFQVDFRAAGDGIRGYPASELPSLLGTLRQGWVYIIPLVALIVTLFILYMPPALAALFSSAAVVIATLVNRDTRSGWSWNKLFDIFESTSKTLFEVTAISAAAGFVVGIISYTGLGLSLSKALTEAAGSSMLLLALLTAITSVILGMGMPTTAAYILLAVLAAPALIDVGVQPILAHLFIFYFGSLSMLTPPVCLAAYAAGSIANAPQMRLAFRAMKLAIAGYVVPFIFLYDQQVALMGSFGGVIIAISLSIIVIVCLAISIEGYFMGHLGLLPRAFLACAAFVSIAPIWKTRALGLGVIALVIIIQVNKSRKWKTKENVKLAESS